MKRIVSVILVVSAFALLVSNFITPNNNVGTVDDPLGPKSVSIIKTV